MKTYASEGYQPGAVKLFKDVKHVLAEFIAAFLLGRLDITCQEKYVLLPGLGMIDLYSGKLHKVFLIDKHRVGEGMAGDGINLPGIQLIDDVIHCHFAHISYARQPFNQYRIPYPWQLLLLFLNFPG